MSSRFTILQLISRDAKIIIVSNSFRSFSAAVLAVSFPIYLSKMGASTVLIGLTFTGISLFSAIRSLIEGIVADRIGRKPILLFVAMTLVVGGAVYVITSNLVILLVSAVLFTIGGTITYTPAELALLSEKVGAKDRTMAFSVNATLGTVAGILGSFAAAIPELLQRLGYPELQTYQTIFIIFTVVGAICLVLFSLIKETRTEADPKGPVEPTVQDVDERRLLLKWSGVVALDQIGGSFNNLLNYWYYLRFGVGPAEIGALNGVMHLINSLSYALGLKMAERFGTIRATVLSRVPVFTINCLTPFMPSFAIVSAARLFMSLFSNIDVPLRQSYIMGVTRSRIRASAYGFVQVVGRFTSSGAPAITGYLYEYVNLAIPFFGAASFQFASAASMYLLFKDIKPPEERAT